MTDGPIEPESTRTLATHRQGGDPAPPSEGSPLPDLSDITGLDDPTVEARPDRANDVGATDAAPDPDTDPSGFDDSTVELTALVPASPAGEVTEVAAVPDATGPAPADPLDQLRRPAPPTPPLPPARPQATNNSRAASATNVSNAASASATNVSSGASATNTSRAISDTSAAGGTGPATSGSGTTDHGASETSEVTVAAGGAQAPPPPPPGPPAPGTGSLFPGIPDLLDADATRVAPASTGTPAPQPATTGEVPVVRIADAPPVPAAGPTVTVRYSAIEQADASGGAPGAPGGPAVEQVGASALPPPDPTGVMPSLAVAAAASAAGTGNSGAPAVPPGSDPAPAVPSRRRRRRLARPLPLAGAGVVMVLSGLVAAWAVDSARTDGEVMRGVTLDGISISGLDRDGLDTLLGQLDTELSAAPLTVRVDEIPIETNPAALGAELDRSVLIKAALDARRGGNPVTRPFRWLGTFFTTETIEPRYAVDPAGAEQGADEVVTAALDQPVDPDLMLDGTDLVVAPGEPGVRVTAQEIVDELPAALAGNGPYELTLTAEEAQPRYRDDQIQEVVDEVTALTTDPVEFRVLDQRAEVPPEILRDWIRLDTSGDEPSWLVDGDTALTELKPLFPLLGSEDQRARFSIVDGQPIIVPASETVICCDAESVAGIADALLQAAPPASEDEEETGSDGEETASLRVVTLEPEIVGADEGVAELESLGIVEEVGTFTTQHPCCQNRVTNIHRFADLVRGVVIRPGEDFSLNDHVGQRTVEKGFVADHAIVEGVLEDQVGGGVSQFATTFFNASFFAGLDFNEYQSHSLYISRYPRGREATISWKKPNLSVKNTTPYGILVWTSYTDTSLTVTFYSTLNVDVATSDPVRSAQGQCSRWTTPRTRTYPDGRSVEDSVFAVYRPAEGLDCNGNSTRPEGDEPQGPTIVPDNAPPPPPAPATTSDTIPPAPEPPPTVVPPG